MATDPYTYDDAIAEIQNTIAGLSRAATGEALFGPALRQINNDLQAVSDAASWGPIFARSDMQMELDLAMVSVRATGWAMGKSDQEIATKAREKLIAKYQGR